MRREQPTVVVCVKWAELRAEIDPLHGTVRSVNHGHGISEADLAAVETALRVAEQWSGRVDLIDRNRRLVIEIQSERYHSSLSDREADARRRAQLARDGFVVVELTDLEVWGHGERVRAKVRDALRGTPSVLLSVTDP